MIDKKLNVWISLNHTTAIIRLRWWEERPTIQHVLSFLFLWFKLAKYVFWDDCIERWQLNLRLEVGVVVMVTLQLELRRRRWWHRRRYCRRLGVWVDVIQHLVGIARTVKTPTDVTRQDVTNHEQHTNNFFCR